MKVFSNTGFLLLFPFFFFYHLVVSAGLLPNFAGGFFGPVTVVLFVLFFPFLSFFLRVGGERGRLVSRLFWILVVYASIWIAVSFFYNPALYIDEAASQAVALVFAWASLFFVGVGVDLRSKYFVNSLWASFLAMGVVTLALFDPERMMFNPRAAYEVEDGVATYQGYARSALLCCLFLMGLSSTFLVQLTVFFSSVILLFLLGARSELFGFIAIVMFYLMLESLRSTKKFAVYVFFLILAGFLFASHFDDFMASRQSEVLNLDDSTSWSGRTHYLSIALKQIVESPVLGEFGGHFEAGGKGTYAHNILSAWVEFGFVGVFLLAVLCLYCFLISFLKCLKTGWKNKVWVVAYLVNGVFLLLVFVSKPVFWSAPALGWGLVVGALWLEQQADKISSINKISHG